jgi:hypothetical protein
LGQNPHLLEVIPYFHQTAPQIEGDFPISIPFGAYDYTSHTYAPFTLGVRANVQTKPSIPIGAKAEINLPQLSINAELYDLVYETVKFGRPICNPWGPIYVPAFK